jgi:hypothetical protein
MQTISIVKKIKLKDPIPAKHFSRLESGFWLMPGEYKVRREFDKARYLIETPDGLTLVEKSLTQELK